MNFWTSLNLGGWPRRHKQEQQVPPDNNENNNSIRYLDNRLRPPHNKFVKQLLYVMLAVQDKITEKRNLPEALA